MKTRPFFKYPLAALGVNLLIYVVITLLELMGNWTWDWAAVRRDLWFGRFAMIASGCLLAGALRIAFFHPRIATKYGNWLASTPWRPGLALPLGPLTLVWEDLFLIVPMTLLAVGDATIPAWVPITFYLLGYCCVATSCVRDRRSNWFAFGQVLIWSLPIVWFGSAIALIAGLLAAGLLAHFALAVSLTDFPWDLADSMRDFKRRPLIGLAWPLNRVGPAVPPAPIPTAQGLSGAALCGWWIFILLRLIPEDGRQILFPVLAPQISIICVGSALWRAACYCTWYWQPLTFRGRIMTGQLIIPGYDYVLITPLIMCVMGFVLPRLLGHVMPFPIVFALTVALVIAVGFNGAPTRRSWQLTGHHRLFPIGRREPVVPKARAVRD